MIKDKILLLVGLWVLPMLTLYCAWHAAHLEEPDTGAAIFFLLLGGIEALVVFLLSAWVITVRPD